MDLVSQFLSVAVCLHQAVVFDQCGSDLPIVLTAFIADGNVHAFETLSSKAGSKDIAQIFGLLDSSIPSHLYYELAWNAVKSCIEEYPTRCLMTLAMSRYVTSSLRYLRSLKSLIQPHQPPQSLTLALGGQRLAFVALLELSSQRLTLECWRIPERGAFQKSTETFTAVLFRLREGSKITVGHL